MTSRMRITVALATALLLCLTAGTAFAQRLGTEAKPTERPLPSVEPAVVGSIAIVAHPRSGETKSDYVDRRSVRGGIDAGGLANPFFTLNANASCTDCAPGCSPGVSTREAHIALTQTGGATTTLTNLTVINLDIEGGAVLDVAPPVPNPDLVCSPPASAPNDPADSCDLVVPATATTLDVRVLITDCTVPFSVFLDLGSTGTLDTPPAADTCACWTSIGGPPAREFLPGPFFPPTSTCSTLIGGSTENISLGYPPMLATATIEPDFLGAAPPPMCSISGFGMALPVFPAIPAADGLDCWCQVIVHAAVLGSQCSGPGGPFSPGFRPGDICPKTPIP